jgi:hypothetical protein
MSLTKAFTVNAEVLVNLEKNPLTKLEVINSI